MWVGGWVGYLDGTVFVVLAIHGVSGCEHGAAGVQGGVDAGLVGGWVGEKENANKGGRRGDRSVGWRRRRRKRLYLGNSDGLLLHDLVNGHSVRLAHLVELINADSAAVSQHHCACLQSSVPCISVRHHSSCETHTRGASPSGTDSKHGRIQNSPQQLGFGRGRVAHHQYVHIPTQMRAIGQAFLHPTDGLEDQGSFDEVVAVDGRSERTTCGGRWVGRWVGGLEDQSAFDEIVAVDGRSQGATCRGGWVGG